MEKEIHIKSTICLFLRRSESVAEEAQCTFEDKVKNAMRANYSAAIIYNYKSDDLIPMGGASDDVIPSVFIGYTDATRLIRDYTYYTGVHGARSGRAAGSASERRGGRRRCHTSQAAP